MKIIQIMDNLITAGGVNSFVYDLCIALKEAGQDVTLIGIIGDPVEVKGQALSVREAGIPVHCLCMNSKKKALAIGIPKLREIIKKIAGTEKTICNLHLKLSVLMGGLATIGLKNVKCVETYHSQYSSYSLEYNLMKRRMSKYICCSKSAYREFMERFHAEENKVIPISNGIDIHRVAEMAKKGAANAKGSIQAVSVGRFTDQKNLMITVKAFSQIEKWLDYVIIGEGPEEMLLRSMANDNIIFRGVLSRQDTLAEVSNSDIVVMPSLWEGLSIFLLEAMALGKPLILSDISSFRETVDEKELADTEQWRICPWGYLVKTSDVNAYYQAILHFKEHPENWMNIERRVLEIASQFDIHNVALNYLKVYCELIEI